MRIYILITHANASQDQRVHTLDSTGRSSIALLARTSSYHDWDNVLPRVNAPRTMFRVLNGCLRILHHLL